TVGPSGPRARGSLSARAQAGRSSSPSRRTAGKARMAVLRQMMDRGYLLRKRLHVDRRAFDRRHHLGGSLAEAVVAGRGAGDGGAFAVRGAGMARVRAVGLLVEEAAA